MGNAWCEKYVESGFAKPLWRYGYNDIVQKTHLLSKPNLKKIYSINN